MFAGLALTGEAIPHCQHRNCEKTACFWFVLERTHEKLWDEVHEVLVQMGAKDQLVGDYPKFDDDKTITRLAARGWLGRFHHQTGSGNARVKHMGD